MKPSLCNVHVYPITPHFYIVKLGFTQAVSTCTHNLCFEQKEEKYQTFSTEIAIFTAVKNCTMLHRHVWIMNFQKETDYGYTFKVPYF